MKRWGIRCRLFWCENCNIPLRQSICGRCGGRAKELYLGEPGDIRPVFSGDLRIIREAIVNEFGDEELYKLLGIRELTTYLNKVPHFDDMKEVIKGGVVIGRLYFDPKELRWRWRLSRYSALLAVEKGLVKVFRRDKVRPLEVLGDGEGHDKQAVVINNRDEPIAIALTKKGKYRVQKIFEGKLEYPIERNASFNDVLIPIFQSR